MFLLQIYRYKADLRALDNRRTESSSLLSAQSLVGVIVEANSAPTNYETREGEKKRESLRELSLDFQIINHHDNKTIERFLGSGVCTVYLFELGFDLNHHCAEERALELHRAEGRCEFLLVPGDVNTSRDQAEKTPDIRHQMEIRSSHSTRFQDNSCSKLNLPHRLP